jgi:hypothetical protein
MIDYHAAREIAIKHIYTEFLNPNNEDKIVITEDRVIEKEWGWIFICQDERWVKNRERSYIIIGIPTIIVDKKDGGVHYLDDGKTMEECINNYIKRRKINLAVK